MKPGIEKTLIDMIVETNESFNMMVGDSFPRKEKIIKHPVHACLGRMVISGGGALSLVEAVVGTSEVFFDVSKAEEEGYFGANPKIWGEREYDSLVELLAVGLTTDPLEWENFRWSPTVRWSAEGTKIAPGQVKAINEIAAIVRNPSEVACSALVAPIVAADAFFGTT